MIQLSSRRRLSSFNGVSLPDIDSGKANEREQALSRMYANSKTQLPDGTAQTSSLPEYETWIEMGPEGEIVQRRRLVPLPKSQSDSALNNSDPDGEKESRIESFLNRTKNIFSSDKLKKSVDLFSGRSSANEERKASWSPDSDDRSQRINKNNGSKFRSFSNSGFKAPLKELHDRIKEKISERKVSQDSDVDENSRSYATRLGFLSDIRSRFTMSPMLRKKTADNLTDEELERRKHCKTLIIDL